MKKELKKISKLNKIVDKKIKKKIIPNDFLFLSSAAKFFFIKRVQVCFNENRNCKEFKNDFYITDMNKDKNTKSYIFEKTDGWKYILYNPNYLEVITSKYLEIILEENKYYLITTFYNKGFYERSEINISEKIVDEFLKKDFLLKLNSRGNIYCFSNKMDEYFYNERNILIKNKMKVIFKFISFIIPITISILSAAFSILISLNLL